MMRKCRIFASAIALAAALAAGEVFTAPAQAADIIAEWANVKAPPPPALKPVTVDPKTTALLMLDFLPSNCGKRPRCLAEMPALKKLLDAAREAKATVIYSGFGKAKPSDILKDVAPTADEPMVHAQADKFMGTDLDKMLKDKGVKTVIVTGTSANGAVMVTACIAGLMGYNVLIPVDGLSANGLYAEQFSVWELSHGPGFAKRVTITRSDMIKF
jgi:nicotinamidase-related amidase